MIRYTRALVSNPINKQLLDQSEAKTGLTTALQNIILNSYSALLTYKAGIEKAGSIDGTKVAKAIKSIRKLPTTIPRTSLNYSASNHWGYPTSSLQMCSLKTGPYDLVQPVS